MPQLRPSSKHPGSKNPENRATVGPRGVVSSSVVDREVGDAGYRDVLAPVLETTPLGPVTHELCVDLNTDFCVIATEAGVFRFAIVHMIAYIVHFQAKMSISWSKRSHAGGI